MPTVPGESGEAEPASHRRNPGLIAAQPPTATPIKVPATTIEPGRGLMPALLLAMFSSLLVRSIYGPLPNLIAADLKITVPLVAQMLTVETALTIVAAVILALLSTAGRIPALTFPPPLSAPS